MTELEHVSSTRAVYDATAGSYAAAVGTEVTATFEGPIDRAFLTAFVESVRGTAGTVVDVGCGPGRVTAFLAKHGLDAVGVDVSSAMLATARDAHPDLHFEDGELAGLPFDDESLVGAVCWYSIIHTPSGHLDAVFAELGRVLIPEGSLLVGFQAGEGEALRREDAHGTGIALTHYRHDPDDIVGRLGEAEFQVHARAVREPELPHESTPQAFILARRSAIRGGSGSPIAETTSS